MKLFNPRRPLRLAFSLAIAWMLGAAAQETPAGDPMEPRSDPRDAIVSPLRVITVTTGDMVATRRFYQGAMGMTPTETRLSGPAAQALVRQWGLAPSERLQVVTFTRPGLADATMVRAIAAAPNSPTTRPDYNAEFTGALGMGVPVAGLPGRDAIVGAYGFKSAVGITQMDFPRADKTTYTVGEVHYLAPDDVLVLGVDRGEMRPVGPIDPALAIGGPAYSSALIDDAERSGRFFRDVLGLEMRREFNFKSRGPNGGMKLPAGSEVRFQQWFAPGSRTGYLVIMDLVNGGKPAPSALGPRSRGLGMWSFETSNLGAVAARARNAGARLLQPARLVDAPGLGPICSMVVASPDGFPIEVFARTTRKACKA